MSEQAPNDAMRGAAHDNPAPTGDAAALHAHDRSVISDAGARRALAVLLVLSLVLGAIWGLSRYGTLADVRAWNLTGLVMIALVFGFGVVIGLMGWLAGRR